MIKLQLLLRHPGQLPAIDAGLGAVLAAHGMRVTGAGRASISADISDGDFTQLFGLAADVRSGFARAVQATPSLPVPADLAGAISLITVAPQHGTTNTIL
jgi:hypothetical protein